MANPPKMRSVQSLASKRAAITAHESAVKASSKAPHFSKLKPLVKRAKSSGAGVRRDSHGRFA